MLYTAFIMKTKLLFLAAVIGLTFFNGCGNHRQLKIKAFIDGSDVVKLSGNKIWFEHETFALPGKTIYLNGTAWSPVWTDKTNATFEGLSPAFRPDVSEKIQVSKQSGRGEVAVVEMPTPENNETLVFRINDDAPGADWYEVLVSW